MLLKRREEDHLRNKLEAVYSSINWESFNEMNIGMNLQVDIAVELEIL